MAVANPTPQGSAGFTSRPGKFHQNCFNTIISDRGLKAATDHNQPFLNVFFSNVYGLRAFKMMCLFSADPLPLGQLFQVKFNDAVDCRSQIGVTMNDPGKVAIPTNYADLNDGRYWHVGGYSKESQLFMEPLHTISPGDTVGCRIADNGRLYVYKNGSFIGSAYNDIPITKHLWAFVCCWSQGRLTMEADYTMLSPRLASRYPYNGREYFFLTKPDDELLCVVCQSLAQNPQQAPCCGRTSCQACVPKWTERLNTTPHCRHGIEEEIPMFADTRAQRQIEALEIYCPNIKIGCRAVVKVSGIHRHLLRENGCSFQKVKCPKKCGKEVYRSHLQHHIEKTCDLRPLKCRYCAEDFPYRACTTEHLDECPAFPLPCPNNCGTVGIVRRTLPKHRSTCPLEVTECKYKSVGCNFNGIKEAMEQHMSTYVRRHLYLTKICLDETKTKLSSSEDHIGAMEKKQIATEERLAKAEITLSASEDRLYATEKKLAASKDRLLTAEMKLATAEERLAAMERKQAATEDRLYAMEMRLPVISRNLTPSN